MLTTREPGGTAIGEQLRSIVLDPAHTGTIKPLTSLLLFNASRHQWLNEVVAPALAQDTVVLADRSFLTSMVYQGYIEGIDMDFVQSICLRAMGNVMPDKIFLLDISPEEIRRRLNATSGEKTTRYDVMADDFHTKAREGYLAQAGRFPDLIKKIDGQAPIDEITEGIVDHITAHLDQA